MTQEDKELLLKDLCSRLPYGVICSIYRIDDWNVGWRDEKLSGYFYDGNAFEFYFGKTPISIDNDISKIKPYLRPLSSMTDKEQFQLGKLIGAASYNMLKGNYSSSEELLKYVYKNHIDLFGLIPKGLALEVNEKNNPYKE